jgi:hypothetical protein
VLGRERSDYAFDYVSKKLTTLACLTNVSLNTEVSSSSNVEPKVHLNVTYQSHARYATKERPTLVIYKGGGR